MIGDTAVVVGRSDFLNRDGDGNEYGMLFRYTGVYIRSGGVWPVSLAHLAGPAQVD